MVTVPAGYADSFATAPLDVSTQQQYADSFATAPLDAGTLGVAAYAQSFTTAQPTGTDTSTDVRLPPCLVGWTRVRVRV